MASSLKIRCHKSFELGGRLGLSRRIYIVDGEGKSVPHFEFMCESLDSDVHSALGSGADFLKYVRRVENGKVRLVDADGNGWITYISKAKVWFEGLYSQGEGGDVTFLQYKTALEVFLKYLSDPNRESIEADFPES